MAKMNWRGEKRRLREIKKGQQDLSILDSMESRLLGGFQPAGLAKKNRKDRRADEARARKGK